MRGTGEQKQFLGTGNTGNNMYDFDFGGHGNKLIYFRGTSEQVTPPFPGRASSTVLQRPDVPRLAEDLLDILYLLEILL